MGRGHSRSGALVDGLPVRARCCFPHTGAVAGSGRCSHSTFVGFERVKVHAYLTILAQLACALARARAVLLAAKAAHVEKRVGSP